MKEIAAWVAATVATVLMASGLLCLVWWAHRLAQRRIDRWEAREMERARRQQARQDEQLRQIRGW